MAFQYQTSKGYHQFLEWLKFKILGTPAGKEVLLAAHLWKVWPLGHGSSGSNLLTWSIHWKASLSRCQFNFQFVAGMLLHFVCLLWNFNFDLRRWTMSLTLMKLPSQRNSAMPKFAEFFLWFHCEKVWISIFVLTSGTTLRRRRFCRIFCVKH